VGPTRLVTRLVFITQQFDPEDPLLAGVVSQVAALARRVDEIVVVADRVVLAALPANGRGYSFHSATKLGRGLRLLAVVARELPGLRSGAVVAHMCPVYAIVVAPLVRPARVPLVMWWSHSKVDRVVRLAERVCTRVVSVDSTTFPLPSAKLELIGQATDVESFVLRAPRPASSEGPLRALVIGRYAPVKGAATILRAARIALDRGLDLRVELYGPAPTPAARAEREALRKLAGELALGDNLLLGPAVTRPEVIELLAGADVLVSNTRGGADRAVYEAAASGVPVLASNPVHADVLDPDAFFERDDPEQLADGLAAVAALSESERADLGRRLRERVVRSHSLDSWATGVLRAAGIVSVSPRRESEQPPRTWTSQPAAPNDRPRHPADSPDGPVPR
jgi:glycosyltransferase involved in cell wall biosynthesis